MAFTAYSLQIKSVFEVLQSGVVMEDGGIWMWAGWEFAGRRLQVQSAERYSNRTTKRVFTLVVPARERDIIGWHWMLRYE